MKTHVTIKLSPDKEQWEVVSTTQTAEGEAMTDEFFSDAREALRAAFKPVRSYSKLITLEIAK